MIDSNTIRAILFDLDGTLRHSRPHSPTTMLDFAVQLGASDSLELRQQNLRWVHYYWAQSTELLADLEIYNSLSPEFWYYYTQRSLLAFGCTPDQAVTLAPEISRLMKEIHKPEDWIPEDIPPALKCLQEAGFKLAIVSNRTDPFLEEIVSFGLHQYFSVFIAAGEINSWKPDPQIFWHALEKLDVKPHEAVYVGDNYYADIIGAHNAGLTPVLIDPDGLFPEAQCAVIRQIGELPGLLSVPTKAKAPQL